MSDEDNQPAPQPPKLVFGSAAEFFEKFLRMVYRRPVGHTLRWSAEWWRCDEAVVRIEALWRAWESLRLDPATGISVWFRDHADPHMAILLSPEGPFAGAKDRTSVGEPLPHTPPPAGMFPDVREQEY